MAARNARTNAHLHAVRGQHKDCDEGDAVINLYDDGSFDHEYVTYGWKAAV